MSLSDSLFPETSSAANQITSATSPGNFRYFGREQDSGVGDLERNNSGRQREIVGVLVLEIERERGEDLRGEREGEKSCVFGRQFCHLLLRRRKFVSENIKER